jgi:hypothetical protein
LDLAYGITNPEQIIDAFLIRYSLFGAMRHQACPTSWLGGPQAWHYSLFVIHHS